jgi:hypothetical protein
LSIDEQITDLPPSTGITAGSARVQYARMQIASSSVLLPQTAVLTLVHEDGTESQNEIRFSGCREYTSESTVHFGNSVEPPPSPTKK